MGNDWLGSLSTEDRELVEQRFATDYSFYAENAPILIQDKQTTEMVPLVHNFGQRYVHWRCWQMADAGLPVRMLIPKSRQLGITTDGAAHKLWISQTREMREIYFLIHDLKPAAKLWHRINRMHKGLHPELRVPITGFDTGSRFDFKNDSSILIASVRNPGVGRAETLHHVHATEMPQWDDAEAVLTGIEESVPDLAGWESSIVLESTCEGIGDYWYWLCKKAEDSIGQYQLAFLPWWLERAYARNPLRGELKKYPLSVDEEAIGKRIIAEAPSFGMAVPSTDEIIRKLLWRRRKKENRGAKFSQEYPMDLREAFQGTGKKVFLSDHVRRHEQRVDSNGEAVACEAPHRLDIVKTGEVLVKKRLKRKYIWQKAENGSLRMWFPPQDSGRYLVSGDFSSGTATDYTALHVLRIDNFPIVDQVAVWHGHISPVEAAYVMSYLSFKYNNALMVPESNNQGMIVVETLVSEIRRVGQRLYHHQVRDVDTGEQRDRPGFLTGPQNRTNMIEDFYDLLGSDDLIIRDPKTLEEIEQFTWAKKTGARGEKAQAPSGAFDDLLMALMIGCYARHQHKHARQRPVTAPSMDYGDFTEASVRSGIQTTV